MSEMTEQEAAAVEAFLKGYRHRNGTEPVPPEPQQKDETIDVQVDIRAVVQSEEDLSEEETDRMVFLAACGFVLKTGAKIGYQLDEIQDELEEAYSSLPVEDDGC